MSTNLCQEPIKIQQPKVVIVNDWPWYLIGISVTLGQWLKICINIYPCSEKPIYILAHNWKPLPGNAKFWHYVV